MSVQQFCLRWNNHQPNFISVCSSLLHNGTLVDVTLAAEGKHLQAHKIVLSACSAYFQTLFTSNPCQHPIVILKDVQYNDLKTMVDFMYYGEVNVSQEQLPQILKTAEMLKIKGLAEMPDAAASLTKSESKSSSDQSEQLQGATGGGGNGGGSDSIWGSTESQQFQSHHHHHHQTQQTQSQQQQHHHHHHQQQQLQQQHHHSHQRRSPSPSAGAGASPATRRKRLRKSSTGVLLLQGSSERTSGEEQHQHGSLDGGSSGNINLSQMNQMSFGGSGSSGVGNTSGSNIAQTIHTKIIKESSSAEADIHPHDSSQESIDETTAEHHHVQQIKPEIDISSVQQSIPIDISGPGTPSDHDTPGGSCTQSQASHTDKIQSRSITPTCVASTVVASSSSSLSPVVSTSQVMGTKRNRFLIRQPRIKRESDAMNRQSPEVMEFDLVNPHSLLSVPPPKIERHASEPAPTITPSSPHLLSVPQSTPFLMKQHSHPLLPSQASSSMLSPGFGSSYGSSTLHRQLSHPLSGTTTLTAISGPPLTITSSTTIANSPPPRTISPCSSQKSIVTGSATSSDILITGRRTSTSPLPIITTTDTQHHQSQHSQQHETSSSSFSATTFIPQSTSSVSVSPSGATSASGLLHFVPVTITKQESEESSSPSLTIATSSSTPTLVKSASTGGGGQSPSVVILQESLSTTLSASTSDHVPAIRTKSEELLRSVSSPQVTRELSLDNPNRSSHCPVIRPGPALGCNFCWNTIDAHGRILRRKTKYHCPECQTNLCIVPCFQEYHERQSSSSSSDNLASTGDNTPLTSSKSLPSAGGLRHYPKTGSI